MALDANTTSHMIPALVVIVIASCSGGGSGMCGGGCVTSCCGGCMAWQSQSHSLTVAVAGGGCGGCGHIMAVAVVLHYIAVAMWCSSYSRGHMA